MKDLIDISSKFTDWWSRNIGAIPNSAHAEGPALRFIGTGPLTDDFILIDG
jgi:hypothetical protein